MLSSSQITDAPTEAARAMLQLLFLMVHSLADQVTARQVLANNQNSHQPARTQGKRRPSAAASRLPMPELEENIAALTTYLSTLSMLEPSAHARKFIYTYDFDVHHMVHSTFHCCNSLLCPNISNHDDAVIGVHHLVQSICNFVNRCAYFLIGFMGTHRLSQCK